MPILKKPLSRIIWIFALYLFLSHLLFIFTSGGWAVMIQFFYVGFFLFCYFALGILLYFSLKASGIKQIVINRKQLNILFIIQALTTLFNYGDCGDGQSGGSMFIAKIISGDYLNCSDDGFGFLLSFLAFTVYFVYLLIMIIKSYTNSKK